MKLDLPSGQPPLAVDHVRNTVAVAASGEIRWNGTAVSLPQLSTQLAAVAAMVDQPQVELKPDAEAKYVLVDQILALTKRARVTRLGFVGNERYAYF